MSFKKILFRELEFIKEESSLFALIILAPFFFAFFYSSVYTAKVETNIKIAVVDKDRTELSRTFTRYLDSHQQLSIYSNSLNYSEAVELVKEDEIPGFIFIDKNFEKDIKQLKDFTLPLYLNNTRFLTSNDINKAVNEVAATMSSGIKLKYLQSIGFSKDQSMAQIEPIRLDIRSLYNFTESYGDFVIPGLLALILQQTLLIGISLSFAKEIEENRLPELFQFAKESFLIGSGIKIIIYLVLFAAIAFFFFSVTFDLFKIALIGSVFDLAILSLFYLISVSSFGFLLSTFIKKKTAVLQFFAFTSLPFFLASGYSWPKDAIPVLINWLMYLIPSTSYLNSYVNITQKGQSLEGNLMTLILLLLLSVVYFLIGNYRLKKLPLH